MPDISLTLTALAIVTGTNKLLVLQTTKGHYELPGFFIGKSDPALQALSHLIEKLDLDRYPQQTLYLIKAPIPKASKKDVFGIIRIVFIPRASPVDLPKSQFELLSKLINDERITPITRTVVNWLLQ